MEDDHRTTDHSAHSPYILNVPGNNISWKSGVIGISRFGVSRVMMKALVEMLIKYLKPLIKFTPVLF